MLETRRRVGKKHTTTKKHTPMSETHVTILYIYSTQTNELVAIGFEGKRTRVTLSWVGGASSVLSYSQLIQLYNVESVLVPKKQQLLDRQ